MSAVVLDASAILALLTGARGAGKVAGIIADAATCSINQAELVGHFVRLGASPDDIRAMLGALPYTVMPADDALAWEAGGLCAVAADLSSGGRFCLALAKRLGVPVYTADRTWRDIADAAGVKTVVIR